MEDPATNIAAREEDVTQADKMLAEIGRARDHLERQYAQLLVTNPDLSRRLVSYQANKGEPGHKWCKYKERFSAALVRYIMERIGITSGKILDPFAGSGTTLFVATGTAE